MNCVYVLCVCVCVQSVFNIALYGMCNVRPLLQWNLVIMRTLGTKGIAFVGCLFCQGWKLYNMLSFVVGKFLLYLSSL